MRLLLFITTFITGSMLTVISAQQWIMRQKPATAATIVYNVQSEHAVQLYRWQADGKPPTPIHTDGNLFDADIAPNGQWLVAIAIENEQDSIVRVELNSGKVIPLYVGIGDEVAPTISPDGTQVAFAYAADNRHYQLYVMNADGSNVQQLTFDSAINTLPTWTPDGNSLIFSRTTGGNTTNVSMQLYRYDFSEHSIAAITTNNMLYHGRSAVSPNGRWLAFTAIDSLSRQPQLFVISLVNGGIAQQVTFGNQVVETPQWAADSLYIYYIAYTAEAHNYDIFRIRYDGTEKQAITATPTINEQHVALSSPIDYPIQLTLWGSIGGLMSVGSLALWGRWKIIAFILNLSRVTGRVAITRTIDRVVS
ncbi:MAG: hypothetical protein CUN55_12625 [Phototrophicales bacterium]|nr:MAG: hypothetical protein CUN55_12625 [Phototrophicales bacterium]